MKLGILSILLFSLNTNALPMKLLAGTGFSAPEIADKGNIPNPQPGDIVLDSTTSSFWGYEGTAWTPLSPENSTTVAARYISTAGQSIPSGSTAIVNFETADYDTTSSVTTGSSWRFTAPSDGKYSVKAAVHFVSANFGAVNSINLYMYKNGGSPRMISVIRTQNAAASYTVNGSDDIALVAGDYIDIRVSHQESTSRSLTTATGYTSVSIHRFGN